MKPEEQVKAYSLIAWDPQDLIELRTLPAGGERFWTVAADLPGKFARIQKANAAKQNVYAGILPRSEEKGTADVCLPGRVVWADFDGGMNPRDAWKLVKEKGLPDPSMVVNSGHGAHLFWRLAAKRSPAELSRAVADMAIYFQSDPAVSDPARILRLPGFTNWKEPIAAAELLFNPGHEYDFEILRAIVPAIEEIKPGQTARPPAASDTPMIERARRYVAMIDGQQPGGRTKTAFKVAGALIRDFGLSDYDALSLLTGWDSAANRPPIQDDRKNYKEGELSRILAHVKRYGKHGYGALADKTIERKPNETTKIEVTPRAEDETREMLKEIEEQMSGVKSTIPMPWLSISEKSKALRPGAVVVLAGPLKSGKSYYAINMTIFLDQNGVAWKYLPLEDSKADFKWRLLAAVANDYRATDIDQEGADYRLQLLTKHNESVNRLSGNVSENPRIGKKDEAGKTVVPKVQPEGIIEWTREALKTSRVVFVDPISQIDFSARDQHQDEADFIRKILAITKDSGGTTVLIAHTVKRSGIRADVPLSAEDVQGSAMYTRLCHTTILVDRHEDKESEVMVSGVKTTFTHNRTVTIAATRNGSGTGVRLAYEQGRWGPVFNEFGAVCKTEKGKKR